jgi:hypothetical protein
MHDNTGEVEMTRVEVRGASGDGAQKGKPLASADCFVAFVAFAVDMIIGILDAL